MTNEPSWHIASIVSAPGVDAYSSGTWRSVHTSIGRGAHIRTLVNEKEHRMGYECRVTPSSSSPSSAASAPSSSNSGCCSDWMSAMEKIKRMLRTPSQLS